VLAAGDYRFGALIIDAVRFVPQSRPRLFIVAVRRDRAVPAGLTEEQAGPLWHPANLVGAYEKLSQRSKQAWMWWSLPAPPQRRSALSDVIEEEPKGVSWGLGWHTAAETKRILGMMSPLNREEVEQAKRAGKRMIGGIYKRTRRDENGRRAQRAEVRFDDVSGCLRTPVGGSSRQIIMVVEGGKVRSRLLAPREAARLMGLPDRYQLPENYNEAIISLATASPSL
jgi:DNA (cytosine-5)-methyltransferase 1